MTPEHLYKECLTDLSDKIPNISKLPDLYQEILKEACELALISKSDVSLQETVYQAFLVCLNLVSGLVEAQLKFADKITFNYRNKSFLIDRNHPILKVSKPK